MMALSFDADSSTINDLMRSVKAGRISHAMMLYGDCGSGTHSAAWYIARALFCEGDKNVLPGPGECQCAACRRFESGNNPDFHVLPTQKRLSQSKTGSISVDDIRELRETLALKPYSGSLHAVMIDMADRMTAAAQNALLKTLEGPVGYVVFLLNVSQPSLLLPTIQSRCRRLRFPSPGVQRCADIIKRNGVDPLKADIIAGCAQGSLGRAYAIAGNKDYLPLREKVIEALKELQAGASHASNAALLIEGGADRKFREKIDDLLEIMEVTARDLLVKQNGGTAYTDVSSLSLDGRRLLTAVRELKEKRASNVGWNGCVETAFINYYS